MCSTNSNQDSSDESTDGIDADGGLSDEELAEALRNQSASVGELGDELADRIEQGRVGSDDTTTMLTEMTELSNLLVQIAETMDHADE